MSKESIKERADLLKTLASKGDRYVAFACDRIGDVNLTLISISKANWSLHSVVPFVLPAGLSPDPQSYFCVIAELKKQKV